MVARWEGLEDDGEKRLDAGRTITYGGDAQFIGRTVECLAVRLFAPPLPFMRSEIPFCTLATVHKFSSLSILYCNAYLV